MSMIRMSSSRAMMWAGTRPPRVMATMPLEGAALGQAPGQRLGVAVQLLPGDGVVVADGLAHAACSGLAGGAGKWSRPRPLVKRRAAGAVPSLPSPRRAGRRWKSRRSGSSRTTGIGRDLYALSVAELETFIAELEAEIARVRAEIERKRDVRGAAEALFRRPPGADEPG